nr:restriction endonuclease subunit S [Streptomyces cellostaticus]
MDGGFPVLRLTALKRGGVDLSEHKAGAWGEEEATPFLVSEGDFLLSRGNGSLKLVGRGATVRRAGFPVAFPDTMIRVRIQRDVILPKYLEFIWDSGIVRGQIEGAARTTAGIYKINQGILEGIKLPIPPLGEQDRIVEALDGYLSRLDAAESLIAASYRRTSALQDSLLQQAFERCSARSVAALGSLIREPLRNGHSARAVDSSDGIRTVSLTAVTTGDFSDRNSKVTSADAHRVKDLWLAPGDILIQRSNTPDLVGTAALYSGPEDWAIYPDLLIRVRVNDQILPEFAVAMLRSPRMRTYFRGVAKGLSGSMPKIDQAAILGASLPVPPVDEQREVVKRVSGLSEQVGMLAAEVARGERRAQHLRLSVLRTAFTGGLVAQDPSDGSVSDLINSIQRRKSKSDAAARPRRPRREASTPKNSLPQVAVQQEIEL